MCDTLITSSNNSAEHLIQNAIGGVRTVRGLLCKPCNDTTGHDWDAELAEQLNGLCHFFAIKRDRGSIPAEIVNTTAGETFRMLPDGGFALMKPTVEKNQIGEQTQYQITARTMSEGRRILEGIKNKFPNLDVEAELAKAKANTSYPEGMIHLQLGIGGACAERAVVKSAVAFAYKSGIAVASCDKALAFLRNSDAPPCFGWYHSTDPVVARPRGVPLHCVAISGDPAEGLLLGYVEYFGFYRAVICLSQTYSGTKINRCYAIDPTTGEDIALSVRLDFTRADLVDIFDHKRCDPKDIK
jgi:hypothetical protein